MDREKIGKVEQVVLAFFDYKNHHNYFVKTHKRDGDIVDFKADLTKLEAINEAISILQQMREIEEGKQS